MKCRKLIAVYLAGFVLLSPVLASPVPASSSSGAWLSDAEIAGMEAAILQAQESLDRSSSKIAAQEKDLKKLWTLCAVLGIALAVDATAHIIVAIKN